MQALFLQELIEQFLIRSFVDGLIALAALEVPSCLLEPVFIGCDRMLLLGLQQCGNPAGSGGFFPNRFAWREIWFWGWCSQLRAFFLKAFFYERSWEPLVDSGLAGMALVPTSMGFPLIPKLPGLFAVVDEGLFALLCFARYCSTRFGAQV